MLDVYELFILEFTVEPEAAHSLDTPFIVINQPWYFFYETNKWGKIPYRMTKPTPAQIEEAL